MKQLLHQEKDLQVGEKEKREEAEVKVVEDIASIEEEAIISIKVKIPINISIDLIGTKAGKITISIHIKIEDILLVEVEVKVLQAPHLDLHLLVIEEKGNKKIIRNQRQELCMRILKINIIIEMCILISKERRMKKIQMPLNSFGTGFNGLQDLNKYLM